MKFPPASNLERAYAEVMNFTYPCIEGKRYKQLNRIEVMFQLFIDNENIIVPFIHRGVEVRLVKPEDWIK